MWFIAFLSSCVEAKKLNTVLLDLSFQELLRVMVSALGCGLLIGLEQESIIEKKVEPSFCRTAFILPFAPCLGQYVFTTSCSRYLRCIFSHDFCVL